ncbi:MAG: hypothetical protein HYT08_05145 [Candidatus Levybacteria bacterium]|nr:hypothetical protein [Candidatus Levybacteria bacterium]
MYEGISEKTLNIGIAWVFGPSNLREIADSYNETRASTSLHNISFLRQVWNRLSREEQPAFKDFSVRKTNHSMRKPRGLKYERWSSDQVREFLNKARSNLTVNERQTDS